MMHRPVIQHKCLFPASLVLLQFRGQAGRSNLSANSQHSRESTMIQTKRRTQKVDVYA